MICTGTGSAPFRAFTMRKQRTDPNPQQAMTLVFGARSPETLPYFGPLKKVPDSLLDKYFAFSRVDGQEKKYVQDQLRDMEEQVAALLQDDHAHIYICGLRAMEQGVESALTSIAESIGEQWHDLRDAMREQGRYHVETY